MKIDCRIKNCLKSDLFNNIVFGFIIGVIGFIFVYGCSVLNPTYDNWLVNGYAESDILVHYGGWLTFRDSPWNWPLGLDTNLSLPVGNIISFTDSIPIVAIFFKLISNYIPDTFQFFGIYIFLCFILQGISSSMLVNLFTKDRLLILIISFFFVFSPIMLERAFRHTALASHWLIVFSLYLYFKMSKENYAKFKWQFVVLNIFAISIHPYFLPMVMGILTATLIDYAIKNKKIIKPIIFLLLNIISVFLAGYSIGVLGWGVNSSDAGFGIFSMNLNSVVNPYSIGTVLWSRILQKLPQILGNYDGFNYLGLGIIVLIIFILILAIFKFIKNKENYNTIKISLYGKFNKYPGLILVCFIFYIFSISNVVTLNNIVVFQYYLPEKIINLCNIFRASSRMFYPVFYIIYLYCLIYIIRKLKKQWKYVLLSCIFFIQIFDMYPVFRYKYELFDSSTIHTNEYFKSETWNFIGNNYKNIIALNDIRDRNLLLFIGKNHMKSNMIFSTRNGMYAGIFNRYLKDINLILSGEKIDTDTVYISSDKNVFDDLTLNKNNNIYICDLGEYRVVIPKKEKIKYIPNELIKSKIITTLELTDANWTNGINNFSNILLFSYSAIKEETLKSATSLKSQNTIINIENVTSDGTYIHVKCSDKVDLTNFSYPNKIEIIK